MKFSKKMSLISLLIFSIQIHGACLFTGIGDTYLHLAVNRDDYADVQQLLPAEARSIDKENNKGETPLHVACNRQKPIFEVVQCLVDTYRKNNNDDSQKVSNFLNMQNKQHKASALIYAVKSGNKPVVEFLLDRGVDLELKDLMHWTPLYGAVFLGDTNIVTVLLDRRANIEAKTDQLVTPLHVAAFAGKTECMQLLLSRGANIEAKTDQLATPLHVAAFAGETECMKLLLDKGANIKAQQNQGFTPYQIVQKKYPDFDKIVMSRLNPDQESE